MEFQEIRGIVEHHIATGERHEHYDLFCHIAKEARAFVTGEGQEVMIGSIRPDEDEHQKMVRIQVSEPKTPEAIAPVKTVVSKVYRSDGITSTYGDSYPDDRKAKLEGALSTFSGGMSLSQYLELQQSHYEFVDPNAWLIVERKDRYSSENTIISTQPYPVEFTSHEAINYGIENGVPIWLLALREGIEFVDGKEYKTENYYFYTAGKTVYYREHIDISLLSAEDLVNLVTVEVDKDKPRYFVAEDHETGSKEFPGDKWGAYRHNAHDDLTVKQPFYYGGKYLLQSILKKSSLKDVCIWKHVYPKMYAYDEKCDHSTEHGHCDGGKIGNRECPSCKGTGSKIHRSELDFIRIAIPPNTEDARELIPVDSFVHYVRPPLEATQFISDDLADDMQAFFLTVLNSNKEQQVFAPRTATEVTFDTENMNNACKPFADQNSRLNEKVTRVSAQYMEEDEGLVYNHSFGKKLGLESSDYLASQIERAKGVNAGFEIINAYYAKWLAKEYPEQPEVANNWLAFERHKPFAGFSEGAVFSIIQERDSKDFDRVLFENWDSIKRNIMQSQPNFYTLSYQRQSDIIRTEVDNKIARIQFRQEAQTVPLNLDGAFDDAA